MSKSLIIGAAGFVGGYLIECLIAHGDEVYATKLPFEEIHSNCTVRELDILDSDSTLSLINEILPDRIFHLAAQSSVALSWKKPAMTAQVNVIGTINVLEAVRVAECEPVVLLVGSSEEYGKPVSADGTISETEQANPQNIYAVTKHTQNCLGRIYHQAYGMKTINVRAFNHFGPGQLPQFVISDFCKQAAEIEAGLREPVIRVGNLAAKRDFTDVRDIVRAYELLTEKGVYGETYNVGSGRAEEISAILDLILSLTTTEISVEVDKSRLRPIDVPVVKADIERISKDTGWQPEIDLLTTISDTLEYWRTEISRGN